MFIEIDGANRLLEAAAVQGSNPAVKLSEIQATTLIIGGSKHALFSAAVMGNLAVTVRTDALVTIDCAGHLPFMTRPKVMMAAITDIFTACIFARAAGALPECPRAPGFGWGTARLLEPERGAAELMRPALPCYVPVYTGFRFSRKEACDSFTSFAARRP